MKYDFNTFIERRNTASVKWDTYPEDVLPMWIADTDFRSPPQVTEAITETAKRGIFGYPLANGKFEEACSHWQQSRFDWTIAADRITWSPSMGTAISLCINAYTRPGDNVAMLWPIYPPFINLCKLNNRVPTGSVLKWRDDKYEIDFKSLEEILAQENTNLFLLCNPHNPTGRVFTEQELLQMGELCVKYNVTVFSDEIHGDIVFKGRHIPFPSVSKDLEAISLVGVNASKTFNVADLRSGAVMSLNDDLLKMLIAEREKLKLGRCSLGIAGVTSAWNDCADYADQLVSYLRENATHALQRIKTEWPGIKAYMPQGTYMLWLDCRELGLSQDKLCDFFMNRAKVALNNGADFGSGGAGFMRMNFGCPATLLDEGINRISTALATF